MREIFTLGSRLQKCADFVRDGARFADIGSDHGYLPIWLMRMGKVKSAVAADIGQGPLSSAEGNAEKYHTNIKTVLSDGFDKLSAEEVDDAVIAGMGGGMISNIIKRAPWLMDKSKRLILEPMTAIPELRQFLFENGFDIVREEAVVDEKKVYSVMLVTFTGESEHDEIEKYMGKIIPASDYSCEYANKVVFQLKNKLKGFEHSDSKDKVTETENLIRQIEERYL